MKKLRKYQSVLLNLLKKNCVGGNRKACVVLPCGGGKSLMEAELAKACIDKGNRVLFIVHRKELIEQIQEDFEKQGVDFNQCELWMVQTLCRRLDKVGDFDVIIVDEAHHSSAKSYTDIFKHFPNAWLFGFTATPGRLNGGLGEIFNNKFIQTVDARWLIDNGYLSQETYYGFSLVNTSGLRVRGKDYSKRDVEELMEERYIYVGAVDHWKKLANGKKTIAYCASVESSLTLEADFNAAGITCKHLDGNTPKEERKQAVQDFRDGKITVLTNCELFGEGFNVPDCECVILLRPTASRSLFIQQSMRCMRYVEGKKPIVIDHVDNWRRHGAPESRFEYDYDSDHKVKKDKDKDDVPVRQCPSCFGIYDSKLMTCPYCGKEHERKQTENVQVYGESFEIRFPKDKEDCKSLKELAVYAKSIKKTGIWIFREAINRGYSYSKQEAVEAGRIMGYTFGWWNYHPWIFRGAE